MENYLHNRINREITTKTFFNYSNNKSVRMLETKYYKKWITFYDTGIGNYIKIVKINKLTKWIDKFFIIIFENKIYFY